MTRSLALAASCAALLILPGAASAASVTYTDVCGDASRILFAAGSSLSVGLPRSQRHDVKSTTVSTLPEGGVRVALTMCGAIPAPETGLASSWTVAARIGDSCSVQVSLLDSVNATRSADYSGSCFVPDPVLPNASTSSETFRRPLSAARFSVAGDTISFTLLRDDFAGPAAEPLATGSTLRDLVSRSRDSARGTEAGQEGTVYVNGPGADDSSTNGSDLTLE